MEFIERLHSRDQHLRDKRKSLQDRSSTPKGLVWDTNIWRPLYCFGTPICR